MVLASRGSLTCLVVVLIELCPRVALLGLLDIPEKDVIDMYNMYREAVGDESRRSASRQVFKNNTEYQIHVKRLKSVNGFKAHNLIIRSGGQTNLNKTIYINNPVESKVPQAFLSLDEFKQALVNRVQKQRETFNRAKLKAEVIRILKVKRKGTKPTQKTKTIDSNKTKSRKPIKKHRQLVLNRLTDNLNISVPFKTKANFTKEQNKATDAYFQVDVSSNKSTSVNNIKSTLVSAVDNVIVHSNKNVTDDHKMETTVEFTAETTTFTEPELIKQNETVTVTGDKTDLTNKAEDITDATETNDAQTATSEDTISEPTTDATVATEELPTESTRITLGRPAVYMGY